MSTYYAVAKIGYEYNDEVYYAGERETYEVDEIYTSKEKAEEKCTKENIEMYKINYNYGNSKHYSISEYGYNTDEIIDTYNLTKVFEKYNIKFEYDLDSIKSWDKEFQELIESIVSQPKKIQKECFECFIVKFYKVVPVNLVED